MKLLSTFFNVEGFFCEVRLSCRKVQRFTIIARIKNNETQS